MRSFIAIPVPADVADAVDDIQTGLRGASWTLPETLHLTLAFLDDQPRPTLEALDAHLLQVKSPTFSLSLRGVGVFGEGSTARLVFAAVAACAPLTRLQAKVAAAARDADIPLPARRYHPHVTLARWRRGDVAADALGRYLAAHSLFAAPPFEVNSFTLFRSDLGRSGAAHTPLAEYPLRG